MADHLFAEEKEPTLGQGLADPAEQPGSGRGADELEGVVENDRSGRGQVGGGDIGLSKTDGGGRGIEFRLAPGLVDHGRGIVQPDKVTILLRQAAGEFDQGIAGGAAEIINSGAGWKMEAEQTGDAADDLGIMRHRSAQHVVEHFGNLIGKGEILADGA